VDPYTPGFKSLVILGKIGFASKIVEKASIGIAGKKFLYWD